MINPSLIDLSLLVPPFLWLHSTGISTCSNFNLRAFPANSASRSKPFELMGIRPIISPLKPHIPVQRSEIFLPFLILEKSDRARLPKLCKALIPSGLPLLPRKREPETMSGPSLKRTIRSLTALKEYDPSASRNITKSDSSLFPLLTACLIALPFPCVPF